MTYCRKAYCPSCGYPSAGTLNPLHAASSGLSTYSSVHVYVDGIPLKYDR